jgi:hypothetical protein
MEVEEYKQKEMVKAEYGRRDKETGGTRREVDEGRKKY